MPQLRRHPITGDWVVIAPERAKRPDDFIRADTAKPQSKVACPFCETGKMYREFKDRIKEFEDKYIYVTPNLYPAFIEDAKRCSERSHRVEEFYRMGPALGGHDVVVIKNHDVNLPSFDLNTWNALFSMIQRRYMYYKDFCNALYAMPIYNYKMKAGASIVHPHAQIFVSNIIPNVVADEMEGSEEYFQKHSECVFCAMNEHEKKIKKRVIYESDKFIAYTFFAARFPFEIWLLPKQHLSNFEKEDKESIQELAKAMRVIINKLYKTLKDPALNFFIHSLPNTLDDAKFFHWHLEITPRITGIGGYELGSGVIIDIMSPEDAAEYLNKENKVKD